MVKDGRRFTTLGIIHPSTQIIASYFYETFSSSLLASCANGEFSLRRPINHTPLFSEAELNGETTFRLGIPHVDPVEGDSDLSHVVSYFSYGKYNLLGKFVESEEFKRLEKRFRFLNMSDISRCFASIYTHSVAWAVKGKEFSKKHKGAFSFESKFDELMQSSNYGETNGIVIGPEVSRIFAGVILQNVDSKVSERLKPLFNNKDYAVRRYVDDYFIFSNSIDLSDNILSIIGEELEVYKLFPNLDKLKASTRPFISGISLARSEVAEVINDLYCIADEIYGLTDASIISGKSRSLKAKATTLRQACGKHGVELHVVSGWLLTNLRNILTKIVALSRNAPDELSSSLYLCLAAILDLIFYVCAVDLRVRTTYALCQCLHVVNSLKNGTAGDLADRVDHFVSEEMGILIRNALALGQDAAMGVEMANLLITGRHYIGSSFLKTDAAAEAIDLMAYAPGISYFRFITVKFCCRNDPSFTSHLETVNRKASEYLISDKTKITAESQSYLIFCDYLSSPDTTLKQKRALIRETIGGNPPDTVLEEVVGVVGFVDWEGTAIQHTLERKALRPVYTWS
ncbi:antiviral reverse transcriptase Drt3b [Sphingomonas sp. PB2P12]|uniref:antiviral reverse transcriptase Drt3b n=1 Tax=Sphingomonas sandaracina TaxID=3096157 RepID=UPI002FCA6EF8